MSKRDFIMKLKDPLYAEAMKLDELVESLALGNTVETIPGASLMYITIFMNKCFIGENERRTLEWEVQKATKLWWFEGAQYVEMHSQITMGFRVR